MSISLSYNDLYLSNLSPDFTAGAILAFFTVANTYTITIIVGTEQVTLTKDNTLTFLTNSPRFNSYVLYTNISPQEFDTVAIPFDRIGWWLSGGNNIYNLVVFETKEFIDGFISLCNYLNTDFRNYIAGTPFYISSGVKVPQYIAGYDIPPYVDRHYDHPAQIFPYYTGSIEDDSHAADWI